MGVVSIVAATESDFDRVQELLAALSAVDLGSSSGGAGVGGSLICAHVDDLGRMFEGLWKNR